MENELYIDGLSVSTGVIETIVSLAAAEVRGVAGIGAPASITGIKALLSGAKTTQLGVTVSAVDDIMNVEIRMQVYYGFRLVDVAAAVRNAVSDAVAGQLGIKVNAVDIFIDGVVFAE